MAANVIFHGKSHEVSQRDPQNESSGYLKQANTISMELIKAAEHGGGLVVFPLVNIADLGKQKLDAREENDITAQLAHTSTQIEMVPASIEVGLVGSNELLVKHQGARIVYPKGLATFTARGDWKLGPRFTAFFPNKKDVVMGNTIEGVTVHFDVVMKEQGKVPYYKMEVVTCKNDTVVIAQYAAHAGGDEDAGKDFFLVKAKIFFPAQLKRPDLAPFERKLVRERIATPDSRQLLSGQGVVTCSVDMAENPGSYVLTTATARNVQLQDSEDYTMKMTISHQGKMGKREITIPTVIPEFNTGLALSDLSNVLQTESGVLGDILKDTYENGVKDLEAGVRGFHSVE